MSRPIEIDINTIIFFQNREVFEKMFKVTGNSYLFREYISGARIFFRDHKRLSKINYNITYNPVPFYLFKSCIKNSTNYSSSHESTKREFWENSNCILNIKENYQAQNINMDAKGKVFDLNKKRVISNKKFFEDLVKELVIFDNKLIKDRADKFVDAYSTISPHLTKILFCEFDYEKEYIDLVNLILKNTKFDKTSDYLVLYNGYAFKRDNLILINININDCHNFKIIPHEIIHIAGHLHPKLGGYFDGYSKNDKKGNFKNSIMNYHSNNLDSKLTTIESQHIDLLIKKYKINVGEIFKKISN